MSNFFEHTPLLHSHGNWLTRDQLQTENSWLRQELHKAQQKITADKKAFELLYKQSQVDFLTQTPTRLLLQDRASQAFKQAKRQHSSVIVMFLDVDHFKCINDRYGHDIGDRVLIELTQRLRTALRTTDTVCRYGGDEFVLLLPLCNNQRDVASIAGKLLQAVNQPMPFENCTLQLAISIGVSMYPVHGDTLLELVQQADHAMYQAKQQGGQRYRITAVTPTPPLVAERVSHKTM